MNRQRTKHIAVGVLLRIASAMYACGRGLRAAGTWLDVLLEKRRRAAAAMHDFSTMSERELHDIGITSVDVNRVAWGADPRS